MFKISQNLNKKYLLVDAATVLKKNIYIFAYRKASKFKPCLTFYIQQRMVNFQPDFLFYILLVCTYALHPKLLLIGDDKQQIKVSLKEIVVC